MRYIRSALSTLLLVLAPGVARAQEALPSRGGKEVAAYSTIWTVRSLAVSPDGKRIYSGNDGFYDPDDIVYEVDVATGKSERQFPMKSRMHAIALSLDGKRLAIAGVFAIRVFDTGTLKQVFEIKNEGPAFTNISHSIAFSADGKRLVIGGGNYTTRKPGDVKVRDALTGNVLLDLAGHDDFVYAVAMSRDGKRVVSGCRDGTAKVWDADNGKELLTLKGHTVQIMSVAISTDGKRIVTGGGGRFLMEKGVAEIRHVEAGDGEVRVWDADTGKQLFDLKGQTHKVLSVAFSPDGKRIAAGGWDCTVSAWDTETGRELATLRAPKEKVVSVNSVTFTPDGLRILGGGSYGRIFAWELDK